MQIEVKRLIPLLVGLVVVAAALWLLAYLAGHSPLSTPLSPSSSSDQVPTEEQRMQALETLRAPASQSSTASATSRAAALRSLAAPAKSGGPSKTQLSDLQSLRAN